MKRQQANQFSQKILKWYKRSGRHDLPWQKQMTPYRVWVSEIMLQQTQVKTVIPYYQKFMREFPNLKQLAEASIDEVLHLWTGLGYYARARNLHRCAQIIQQEYKGRFPNKIEQVIDLPGIGQSTAGAILALAKKQRHPILDGNVKRVLCRYFMVPGWPEKNDVKQKLWEIAEQLTPQQQVAEYTQAMMDLGATLCTRSQPQCELCPVEKQCLAKAEQQVKKFPYSKPKKPQPIRTTQMLIISNSAQQVFLQKRPPTGIWGGLWIFPECPIGQDVTEWCRQQLGMKVKAVEEHKVIRHTFSHFHLDITPVDLDFVSFSPRIKNQIQEPADQVWYNSESDLKLGFATPVKNLLNKLVT